MKEVIFLHALGFPPDDYEIARLEEIFNVRLTPMQSLYTQHASSPSAWPAQLAWNRKYGTGDPIGRHFLLTESPVDAYLGEIIRRLLDARRTIVFWDGETVKTVSNVSQAEPEDEEMEYTGNWILEF